MNTNVEIIRAHYAASAAGDIDAMMTNVSAQVRWTEMAGFPCAGTWVGPQAVIDNVFAVLGKEWENYRFELQTLIDGGDHILGVGTYRGVYRATGKAVQAPTRSGHETKNPYPRGGAAWRSCQHRSAAVTPGTRCVSI